MKDQLLDRGADIGAAVSTVTVAGYTYTNFLSDAALVVAIISGGLAAAWHIYKFYREYRYRKGENYESNKDA